MISKQSKTRLDYSACLSQNFAGCWSSSTRDVYFRTGRGPRGWTLPRELVTQPGNLKWLRINSVRDSKGFWGYLVIGMYRLISNGGRSVGIHLSKTAESNGEDRAGGSFQLRACLLWASKRKSSCGRGILRPYFP